MTSFVGKLVAAFPGVQYGLLHYRKLEKEKTLTLKLKKAILIGHFAQRNGINFLGLKAGFFVLQAFCTDSAPFMPP